MDRFPDFKNVPTPTLDDTRQRNQWGDVAIKDVRHVQGARILPDDSAKVVREKTVAFVARHLQAKGIPMYGSGETVDAYINHGRWVARCPKCNSGMIVWPEWDQAACGTCGAISTVSFPTKEDIDTAVAALEKRPFPENRNWNPKEEPPPVLEVENAERGIE